MPSPLGEGNLQGPTAFVAIDGSGGGLWCDGAFSLSFATEPVQLLLQLGLRRLLLQPLLAGGLLPPQQIIAHGAPQVAQRGLPLGECASAGEEGPGSAC